MLGVFPDAGDEPSIFGIQVGRISFSARCLFRACPKSAAFCLRPTDRIGRPSHRDLLVCGVHCEQLIQRARSKRLDISIHA
jgi:hypothetical protein